MSDWREKVKKVVPYIPGEQPQIKNIIKLNTNENPYPPSPKVFEVLESADASAFRKYPDPDSKELVGALSEVYGVDEKRIFVGVGSDDVLGMAFQTFFDSDLPVLFPDITYSFYDVWCDLYGIKYEIKPLNPDFTINPEDYKGENGGVVIANPNAPTSLAMGIDKIEEIIKANSDSVVIIDEAYVDFGGESALPLLDKYENLLIVRTFSKSRSLAGMRIGFAFGSEEMISYLNAVKNSYNSYTMNMLSIKCGKAALLDREYFKNTVETIIATREKYAEVLKGMGFEMPKSSSNFYFAKHKTVDAGIIFEELKKRNIFVRHWNKPVIKDYLRITVGTDKEMEALCSALSEILKEQA